MVGFFLGLMAFFYVLGFLYKYTILSAGKSAYSVRALFEGVPASPFLKPLYWVVMFVVVLLFMPFYFPVGALLFCCVVSFVVFM